MIDLVGKEFTRLTVLELVRDEKNKPFWKCICECGKMVLTTTGSLKAGYKKSCGCLNTDTRRQNALNMGKKNIQPFKNRFFKYVKKLKGKNACWEWTGDIGIGGYGRFWYKGKTVFAHRLSYIKHKGKIQGKKLVCHTCDNPKCVNPDHLFIGTNQDNYDDMVNKNRRKKVPNSKKRLTKIQVKQILKLLNNRKLIKDIADQFNISVQTVSSIKHNRIWKSIKRERK